MFSLAPPAKALLSYTAIWKSLYQSDWEADWKTCFDAIAVSGHVSGRDAFRRILESVSRSKPERRDIILPAYTCPSMIETVRQSGLTPRLIDMDPSSLRLSLPDLRTKIGAGTLAVVTTNLYGVPDPVSEVLSLCRDNGAYLVEDISLALGCTHDDRPLGTFGDALFFSLGMSKVITTINGGIACWRNEEISKFSTSQTPLRKIDWRAFALQLLYPLALSRFGFGLIDRTPWRLRDGHDFEPRPNLSVWSSQQARLSARLLTMIDADARQRRTVCASIKRHQSALGRDKLGIEADPKLTRYPCLADSEPDREAILRRLRQAGVMGSRGFSHIENVIDLGGLPNTRSLVARLYTVPCYPGLGAEIANRIFGATDPDNAAVFASVQNQYSMLAKQHGSDSKASGHSDIAFRLRKKLLTHQLRRIPGPVNSVLDSGCGNGALGPLLRQTLNPDRLDGADFVSELLQIAASRHGYTETYQTNVLNLDEAVGTKRYTVVNSCEVILYIPPDDYSRFFRAHRACLIEGGYLLLTLPNLRSVYRLLLRPNANFRYRFSPRDVVEAITGSGFEILSVAGIDLFGLIRIELSKDAGSSIRRWFSYEVSILCRAI